MVITDMHRHCTVGIRKKMLLTCWHRAICVCRSYRLSGSVTQASASPVKVRT